MGLPRQVSSEEISPQQELLNEIASMEENARPEFGDISKDIQRLVVFARGLGVPQTTILQTQIQGISENHFLPESDRQWSLDIFNERLREAQVQESSNTMG